MYTAAYGHKEDGSRRCLRRIWPPCADLFQPALSIVCADVSVVGKLSKEEGRFSNYNVATSRLPLLRDSENEQMSLSITKQQNCLYY